MNKGDKVYYARAFPTVGMFEVLELTIRTVEDTWFVGCEKGTKQAYLFNNKALDKTVFYNRKDALDLVREIEERTDA